MSDIYDSQAFFSMDSIPLEMPQPLVAYSKAATSSDYFNQVECPSLSYSPQTYSPQYSMVSPALSPNLFDATTSSEMSSFDALYHDDSVLNIDSMGVSINSIEDSFDTVFCDPKSLALPDSSSPTTSTISTPSTTTTNSTSSIPTVEAPLNIIPIQYQQHQQIQLQQQQQQQQQQSQIIYRHPMEYIPQEYMFVQNNQTPTMFAQPQQAMMPAPVSPISPVCVDHQQSLSQQPQNIILAPIVIQNDFISAANNIPTPSPSPISAVRMTKRSREDEYSQDDQEISKKVKFEHGLLSPTLSSDDHHHHDHSCSDHTHDEKVVVYRRGRKPTAVDDSSKTFMCQHCGRRFRRQEHLKRHFRSLHTREKPFACKQCGKTFSRSDNLAQHARTHAKQTLPDKSISLSMRRRKN